MRPIFSIQHIPYRSIPRQSELFLEYLDLSPRTRAFYQRAPTWENVERAGREESVRQAPPRREAAAILERQNRLYGAGEAVMRCIEDLAQPDSVAVVTGQQVGLFTGPVYTIYKALTTLRLAAELRRRQIRAVPIFWMESEDHDLAEVTRFAGLSRSGKATDFRESLFGSAQESIRPVGSIRFPEKIHQAVTQYLDGLPDSEWKLDIRAQLQSACKPGATFSESFGKLMAQLFSSQGLVLFDAQDRKAKPLVYPVFLKSLRNADYIRAALVKRSRELEASGFHTQVSVLGNSTLLFLHDDGERRPLAKENDGFALKNTRRSFSLKESLELAIRTPEHFSPNVLLRPLVQDHLFPTAAYVGGPAEVAYFAQVEVLYQLFDRPMPVIWPRSGFTLLDPETSALLERYGLSIEDCFHGKERLLQHLVQASSSSRASALLGELDVCLNRELEALRPRLVAAEASLGPALDTAKRKIFHHVESLRKRITQIETRRNRDLETTADALLGACYPNRNLQERELGIYPFLARFGPELLDELYGLVKIDDFVHQVVRLDPARSKL